MRHGLILLAGAALVLHGCGGNDQADIAANADTGLTADKIMTNDVTAIDAVTGEAANMAADVDYSNLIDNVSDADGNSSNTSKPATAKPSTPEAKPAPKAGAKPAPAPASEPEAPANTSG